MSPHRLLFLVALTPSLAFAADLTVNPATPESPANFHTVQAAINAAPSNSTTQTRILIFPGTYEEHLTIPKDKTFLSLIGGNGKPDALPKDTLLTFHLKSSDPNPAGAPGSTVGTTGSASATINANDFSAENLTFANSAGDNVGQAVALKTNSDRLVFKNCRFLSYQDTLYPSGKGRCYFKDCYITGDTDFIFGNATALFDHCTINSSDSGYITAANTTPDTPFGFVFLDCILTAGPPQDFAAKPAKQTVAPGSVYLGRPWQWDRGSNAAVTFLRTKMGPHVAPAGWHPWDAANNKTPEKNTRYQESASTDLQGQPLDLSKRAPWSHPLTPDQTQNLTPQKILAGPDHWKPET